MPPSTGASTLAPKGGELKAMPRIRGQALDGRSVDSDQHRGQILVVKFFATYCVPCKTSLPWFQAWSARHPEVLVLGVDTDDHASQAESMVRDHALTFPVLHDQGHTLAARFRVRAMPITFVIDGQGQVRWVGGSDAHEATLDAAVSAAKSAPPEATATR